GVLLVVDGVLPGVIRVNPLDGSQTVLSSGNHFATPFGVAIAANGDLYVIDRGCCGGQGGVVRVNPVDGSQTVVARGGDLDGPFGIAIAALPRSPVLTANYYGGAIVGVNPVNGGQTMVAGGDHPVNPSGN